MLCPSGTRAVQQKAPTSELRRQSVGSHGNRHDLEAGLGGRATACPAPVLPSTIRSSPGLHLSQWQCFVGPAAIGCGRGRPPAPLLLRRGAWRGGMRWRHRCPQPADPTLRNVQRDPVGPEFESSVLTSQPGVGRGHGNGPENCPGNCLIVVDRGRFAWFLPPSEAVVARPGNGGWIGKNPCWNRVLGGRGWRDSNPRPTV